MKYPLIFLATFVSALHADDGILLQRIVALENRVAGLEARLAPVLEQERIKDLVQQHRELARTRMMMDAEIYQRHDLDIIEKLHETASRDWKADDAGKAVGLLTQRYPAANRTGCAVLSRAQSIEGNEQLELLKQAIGKHGGCYYPNGVQVGPYAKLYLAMRHKRDGNDAEADRLFLDIRKNHPDAVDRNGQLLTSHLEGMETP
jgi:hypothetical protein